MPSQRAAGQKAVIVMMSEDFVSLIDANLSRMGFSDRSTFIREAVRAKLGASHQIAAAPSRAGKGGPRNSRVALAAEDPVDYRPETK